MNECQNDYNQNLQSQDLTNQQNPTPDYNNPLDQQPWEDNQLDNNLATDDYSSDNYNYEDNIDTSWSAQDTYDSSFDKFDPDTFDNSIQDTYEIDLNPVDTYSNSPELYEVNPMFGDNMEHLQRSGHEPTAEDLSKANDLAKQAREEHNKYKNSQGWGDHFKNQNMPNDAQSNYDTAARHKQREEELMKQAEDLRKGY